MKEILQISSPEMRRKALSEKKKFFIANVTDKNQATKYTDVPSIMARKLNKHLNESLKQVQDAAAKQSFEVPNFEKNKYIKDHALEGFINYVAFKQSEIQIKNYEEAVTNKKPLSQSVALKVDADKEFRNYLATKHYS